MKLHVGYLYPSVMSHYGDRGNVMTVVERCRRRGIETEVHSLDIGDELTADLDLLLVGGGADSHQRLLCEDLARLKGGAIRQAIDDGAAALAKRSPLELRPQRSSIVICSSRWVFRG